MYVHIHRHMIVYMFTRTRIFIFTYGTCSAKVPAAHLHHDLNLVSTLTFRFHAPESNGSRPERCVTVSGPDEETNAKKSADNISHKA